MEILQSQTNSTAGAQEPDEFRMSGWKTLSGSSDPVGLMSDFINALVLLQDYKFVLNDEDVSSAQLSDPNGLLGVVLWHAEKTARLAYTGDETIAQAGATLGLQFAEDDDSSLGLRPILPLMEVRSPLPIMILDTIEETFKLNQVYRNTASLDNLVAVFKQDFESGRIPVVVLDTPRMPDPGMPG